MGFLFKSKKERSNAIIDLDEILGYFDEVINQRREIKIVFKNKIFSCGIYQIDDKKRSLRIQDKGMNLYEHENAKCGFSMDNTWFSFNTTFLIIDDKPYLMIPEEIIHKERRKYKRVSFAQRENAQVSILESFGKGVGITGPILNISLGGLCVEIDRAISLATEKEIRPQANLLKNGQKLSLIRIKGIPTVPEIDTSGIVHEIRNGHKWKISIELPKFNEEYKSSLERFIESRSRDFKLKRRSRKKRLETEKRHKEEIKNKEQEKDHIAGTIDIKKPAAVSIAELDKEHNENIIEDKVIKDEVKKKNLISILIVGKPLDRDLFFLRKFTNFDFFIANDVTELVKSLSEQSPNLLFIPHILKDQNMINILIKISQKGVLKDVRVFLFIENMISENEVVKCKTLGVEGILKLPVKDPLVLIKKISKK